MKPGCIVSFRLPFKGYEPWNLLNDCYLSPGNEASFINA